MKKNTILLAGAGIVIVVVAVLFFLMLPSNNPPAENPPPQGNDGIEITLPTANSVVSSPLKITGMVKGNGWTGFEGQVGTVKLFDESNNELGMGILTASADWMQLPTPFETTIFFDYPGDGNGKLVFYNDNASGEAERDRTFTLPVKLAKSSAEIMEVKVFFPMEGDNLDCAKVLPLTRVVPKSEGVARVALEELLKGPGGLEKTAGFFTSINEGVVVQAIAINNGVATVDFNQKLQDGVAGSCNVTAIRAQITQTLKQFSTVTSVVISINGKSEDILQP